MLIYGPLLLFFGMTVFMLIDGEPLNAVLTTGGILFATGLFILYLAHRTKYTISNGKLDIKCGFLYHRNLEISRIKSIAKTSSLLSAPAASLDRIEIKYDQRGIVVISPIDKEAFAKDLLTVNPSIIDKITQ